MTKRIKLKYKPHKPVRKNKVKVRFDLERIDGLKGLEEEAHRLGIKITDFSIEKEWGYYDSVNIYAEATIREPIADFNERMANYKKRKAEYDKWYADNKTKIDAEVKRKANEEKKKAKAAEERELKRLEKAAAKLKKKLGK